jgi:hypothetical protein
MSQSMETHTSGLLTLRFLACKILTVSFPLGGPTGATGVAGVGVGALGYGSVPAEVVWRGVGVGECNIWSLGIQF